MNNSIKGPPNTQLWTFVDLYNDYGLPENKAPNEYTHNANFSNTECLFDVNERLLKPIGERSIMVPNTFAVHLLDKKWKKTAANVFETTDPNNAYNLHRHPGYAERRPRDGKISYMHKCTGSPPILLPNAGSITLDTLSQTGQGYGFNYAGTKDHTVECMPVVKQSVNLNHSNNAITKYRENYIENFLSENLDTQTPLRVDEKGNISTYISAGDRNPGGSAWVEVGAPVYMDTLATADVERKILQRKHRTPHVQSHQ